MTISEEHPEYQYLRLLQHCLYEGEGRGGRNGVTRSTFGGQLRFDLKRGFPLLTTKRVHFKSIVVELLWLLSGSTNIEGLKKHNVSIWDEWAGPTGEVGPIYGHQWRNYRGVATSGKARQVDQIATLISDLKRDPFSRRHIVTAWNPADIPEMALPPCHAFMQFHVSNARKLSCHLYQRSGDIFLGVPFNIASYALLTRMIARCAGLDVGEFVHSFGDVHLYENHVDQAKEQLLRVPKPMPVVILNPLVKDIDSFEVGDINLHGYDPHDAIRALVSA